MLTLSSSSKCSPARHRNTVGARATPTGSVAFAMRLRILWPLRRLDNSPPPPCAPAGAVLRRKLLKIKDQHQPSGLVPGKTNFFVFLFTVIDFRRLLPKQFYPFLRCIRRANPANAPALPPRRSSLSGGRMGFPRRTVPPTVNEPVHLTSSDRSQQVRLSTRLTFVPAAPLFQALLPLKLRRRRSDRLRSRLATTGISVCLPRCMCECPGYIVT